MALITTLPILIPLLSGSTETPIPTLTATVLPTSPAIETLTKVFPTDTATQISTTSTETIVPSLTPCNPSFACLDCWEVIPPNSPLATPDTSNGCTNIAISKMGISVSDNKLIFGPNGFTSQGIFGISTSLPTNASINLVVTMNLLQGESSGSRLRTIPILKGIGLSSLYSPSLVTYVPMLTNPIDSVRIRGQSSPRTPIMAKAHLTFTRWSFIPTVAWLLIS